MTALRNICMLTRYAAWANDCLFEELSVLPAGEALKQRATLFGNMVHTMNHCYVIDLIWQAHLQGRPHGFTKRNTDVCPPLPELREAQRQMDQCISNTRTDCRSLPSMRSCSLLSSAAALAP